jgi:hypothetical protein
MAEPMRFPVMIQTVPMIGHNTDIYFPRVWGLHQMNAQEAMNRQIVEQVNAMIREQMSNQSGQTGQTSMTGYYEIKTNERGTLSLTQSNFAYTPPMAHGITLLKSLNFDVQTGKDYQLGELFKLGSDYVTRINAMIRAQIKERDVPVLDEFKGISANQDFYIADKSLVIYFQLYEITPYVYGFPMFPISAYSLQDIIVEDGPLGRMLPGL